MPGFGLSGWLIPIYQHFAGPSERELTRENPPFPRLSVTLVGFALAAFVAAVLIVSLPLRNYVGSYEREVQSEVALRAGNARRGTILCRCCGPGQ
mgnify:CR=1 FL=1